jgi:hypothetical protein
MPGWRISTSRIATVAGETRGCGSGFEFVLSVNGEPGLKNTF